MRPHTHFLEVITLPRLSMEQMVSRHSRISPTGSEPGLLRDKVWPTAQSLCKSPEKTPATPQLLTLVLPNFLSHLMFLKKFVKSGLLHFLISIASPIRLSATSKSLARRSSTRSNQLVSKWVIIFLKSTPSNIYISLTRANASSLFTNADSRVKIKICSWSEMHSLDISTRCMTLIETRFH